MIARTPKPPYYAVIFSSIRTEVDNGYSKRAEQLVELAKKQDGFLGVENARNELGITVSYWQDLESIKMWKDNAEHTIARLKGRTDWYRSYKVRITRVVKEYKFEKE